MCGCLFVLAAAISPRFGLVLLWGFTDRMNLAFESFWWALIGFIFLPWTTLVFALVYAPRQGVSGFGWVLVAFAFFVDLSTHVGATQARRQQQAAPPATA
jgi:hypothetical protein